MMGRSEKQADKTATGTTVAPLSSPSAERQPRLHELFETAARRRCERLTGDITDAHLDGLEELFRYLDEGARRFEGHRRLRKIAVLVRRLRADFETGVCTFLSGLDQATFDAMRDVMEIAYLLREFLHNPAAIDDWLGATEEDRWRLFGPGRLRQLHANRLGIPVADLLDSREYSAHSQELHVTPREHWFVSRGVSRAEHPELGAAFTVADLFYHAHDIVFLIHRLTRRLAPSARTGRGPKTGLPRLRAAHDLTMKRYRNAQMWIDMATTVAQSRQQAKPGKPKRAGDGPACVV